jgi:hypothetical protein
MKKKSSTNSWSPTELGVEEISRAVGWTEVEEEEDKDEATDANEEADEVAVTEG